MLLDSGINSPKLFIGLNASFVIACATPIISAAIASKIAGLALTVFLVWYGYRNTQADPFFFERAHIGGKFNKIFVKTSYFQ